MAKAKKKKPVAKKVVKKSPTKKVVKKVAKKAAKKAAKKVTQAKVSKPAKAVKKSAPSVGSMKKTPQNKAKSYNPTPTPAKPPVTLREGMTAPDFDLPTESGKKIRLADLTGKTVVLFFYPKDMTPGCTQEACDFRDSIAPLRAKGAEVFGVSRDSVTSHEKFSLTYSLPFSLLADTEGKMCEAYGVWKQKSLYGRTYMGIERTTVVIGPDGRIKKVYSQVKVDGHVQEVLKGI